MRHSRSKNEPCLRVANKPPERLSAAQILVTLGLGKLLNRMGRKKGFKVSFFPDSLCISKKKLSTRHTSLSSLSMRVFRPAEHRKRIRVPNKQHHSCGNSSHFLRTLTPGSMWASVMSATQLHLHPFLLSTPGFTQLPSPELLREQDPDPCRPQKNPSNWAREMCAKRQAGLNLDPWGPSFPRSCVCLMPSVQ